MTAIVDAGAVVAAHDQADPATDAVKRAFRAEPGALVLPAPVSAEVDYLVGRRLGPRSRRAFIADLAAGRYEVPCLEPGDYATVASLDRRYAGLDLGLADLSIVVMAERYGTTRLLSFDERDFRAVAPLQGGSFTLLPADE